MYLPYTSNQYVTINALDFQSVADWNVNFLPPLAKDGNGDSTEEFFELLFDKNSLKKIWILMPKTTSLTTSSVD